MTLQIKSNLINVNFRRLSSTGRETRILRSRRARYLTKSDLYRCDSTCQRRPYLITFYDALMWICFQGVALKSCTQFIQWLKEAEPEEEEDTEKQKVHRQFRKICKQKVTIVFTWWQHCTAMVIKIHHMSWKLFQATFTVGESSWC